MKEKFIPPFRRFVLQNFPFIEHDFDALTSYELWSKVVEYLNKVIHSQNELTEDMQQYIDYINHYFDNLDVQEEINNKLDAMAESGELADIIAGYIELRGILVYDSVASMKSADNLVDGSFVETYGFYEKGDGGGSKYKVREVTNLDTVDEMYLIALADENLVAELIIDATTTIVNFGAKSDRTEDIAPYWAKMLAKCGEVKLPKGRFLLQTPITISTSYNVKCDGNIYYDGNDYAFILANATSSTFAIYRFDAPNGGMFNVSSTDTVSFINFDIKFSWCKKHAMYLNANGGIITMLRLDGTRWSSTHTPVIEMYQDTSTVASAYLSEVDIYNIDFVSSYSAIKATCDHATKSINFNVDNVNLESSAGIHCFKRIWSVGIYNVRMPEISVKQGWLSFTDYMPQVTITGVGELDPSYITFTNVPDYGLSKFIQTNLAIVDHADNSVFPGGGIITSRYVMPNIPKYKWVGLGTSNTITLPEPTTSGNLYNYFTLGAQTEATSITIPTNYYMDFVLVVANAIDVTITKGSNTITIPSTESNTGKILVKQVGNYQLCYTIMK